MENLRYTIKLDTKNGLLPELKIVRKEMDNITQSVKKTSGQFVKLTNICDKLSGIKYGTIAANIQNIAKSVSDASSSGVDFQQGIADLQAITGIVGKDLETITRAARDVGKESGLGAKGAVDAFTLLASQIQIDQIGLKGLLQLQKETIKLAQAGGLSLTDAATSMAATINQFGLEADQANRVVNVLAAGSKYGAAEVTDLAQSFKVTGATASAAGLSVEQTAGALEVLSKSNVKGAEAGTALRNIILKLQTTLSMDLSKVGLANALDSLKPKLDDVTYLAKVFGAENIAAAQYLITNADAMKEMTKAVTATSVAEEQAAIRTSTVAEQQKKIQANIDDLKISLFEITKGWIGYASAFGGTAVMISQMMPLLIGIKNILLNIGSVAGGLVVVAFSKLGAAAKASFIAIQGGIATIKSLSLTIQFSMGIIAMMPARIMAFCKAMTLQKAVTMAATVAQKALNIALTANPIGIVVAALAALAAGLAIAYKRCDKFRAIVDNWTKGFKGLTEWIGKAWQAIKRFFGFGEEIEDIETTVPELTKTFDDLSKNIGDYLNALSTNGSKNLNTIDGLTAKIKELSDAQKQASTNQAIKLGKEIELYKEKLNLLQRTIAVGVAGNLGDNKYKETINTPIKGVENNIKNLPALGIPVKFEISEKLMKENLDKMKWLFSDSIKEMTVFTSEQITGLVTSAFAGMGEAIASGNPLDMLKNVLITIMDMLQAFGSALIAAGAASEALKTVAWSGIGAIIAGGALVATTTAAKAVLKKVTAFADGGIVSGPTLALVGEYGGAKNNPEVIAPLNKLQSLITPAKDTSGLYLETKIKGRDLYIALKGVENERRRTR